MTCKHDPRNTKGPIGMYHCPECNEMVVAGLEHPDYSLTDDSPCGDDMDMSYLSDSE